MKIAYSLIIALALHASCAHPASTSESETTTIQQKSIKSAPNIRFGQVARAVGIGISAYVVSELLEFFLFKSYNKNIVSPETFDKLRFFLKTGTTLSHLLLTASYAAHKKNTPLQTALLHTISLTAQDFRSALNLLFGFYVPMPF